MLACRRANNVENQGFPGAVCFQALSPATSIPPQDLGHADTCQGQVPLLHPATLRCMKSELSAQVCITKAQKQTNHLLPPGQSLIGAATSVVEIFLQAGAIVPPTTGVRNETSWAGKEEPSRYFPIQGSRNLVDEKRERMVFSDPLDGPMRSRDLRVGHGAKCPLRLAPFSCGGKAKLLWDPLEPQSFEQKSSEGQLRLLLPVSLPPFAKVGGRNMCPLYVRKEQSVYL